MSTDVTFLILAICLVVIAWWYWRIAHRKVLWVLGMLGLVRQQVEQRQADRLARQAAERTSDSPIGKPADVPHLRPGEQQPTRRSG